MIRIVLIPRKATTWHGGSGWGVSGLRVVFSDFFQQSTSFLQDESYEGTFETLLLSYYTILVLEQMFN